MFSTTLKQLPILFRPSQKRFAAIIMSSKLDSIADCEIDTSKKFKYIQIKVKDRDSGDHKLIVRGYSHCGFHSDILDEVKEKETGNFQFTCPGGGRIEVNEAEKSIFVYGYSQSYGQPDHSKSVEIIKKKYPDWNVTFSNDGY
uniref:Uncharacterized protein n=1 Tax=Panagrolaimus sp. PS1159 TaxID=55785 RepID=A0AC35FRT1_9BILA